MRTNLNKNEIARLKEVGFAKLDGSEVRTLADLLEIIPDSVEAFRYRPEKRWENMSDPTYCLWLEISKNEDVWSVSYERATWTNPDLCLDYESKELIVCLFDLAMAYASAPKEWIDKSYSIYRLLGESEDDYQERLKRIREEEEKNG